MANKKHFKKRREAKLLEGGVGGGKQCVCQPGCVVGRDVWRSSAGGRLSEQLSQLLW